MFIFRWIFRLIKAALFGALCGVGGYFGGTLVFGIIQLFCGWSKEFTETITWIGAIIFALWAVVTIIRNGIDDDAAEDLFNSAKKEYEDITGEKYTYIPSESIDETPSANRTNRGYSHTDIYGRSTGYTRVDGDSADHYSADGYSASHRSGNDVTHYGVDGYRGRSHISDDGNTVTHYGKDNMPSGYSKKNADGSVDHFDKWGLYQGSSREE
ncbi:MAG: hypothetical protein IJ388_00415 [Oscillospiraceae bacterium]|nr:hypothetical protein [Oscillospiraceae bacterium]